MTEAEAVLGSTVAVPVCWGYVWTIAAMIGRYCNKLGEQSPGHVNADKGSVLARLECRKDDPSHFSSLEAYAIAEWEDNPAILLSGPESIMTRRNGRNGPCRLVSRRESWRNRRERVSVGLGVGASTGTGAIGWNRKDALRPREYEGTSDDASNRSKALLPWAALVCPGVEYLSRRSAFAGGQEAVWKGRVVQVPREDTGGRRERRTRATTMTWTQTVVQSVPCNDPKAN